MTWDTHCEMDGIHVLIEDMAIQRNIVFLNNKAYNIYDTIIKIQELLDNGVIDIPTWEEITSLIGGMQFSFYVEEDHLLVDPYTGVYTTLDLWFAAHGVEDNTMDIILMDDDSTVETFPITDSEFELSDEECIESEDEEEIAESAAEIRRLAREHDEERGL